MDEPIFKAGKHGFNLDYPPPAFIGDVENAPVVLLQANGGFDPSATPKEFAGEGAVRRHLNLLHHPRAVDPATISLFYARRNFSRLIRDGVLALVNAVAYRSPAITREPQNQRLARLLPSTAVHRHWMREELLDQAHRGERLVIFHRKALWKVRKNDVTYPNVIFSRNPVSPDLSGDVLERIARFVSTGRA